MKIFHAAALAAGLAFAAPAFATPEEDARTVAALDTQYQAAVKRNDAETMGRILDDRFVLILGNGNVISRAQLLDGARSGQLVYELQDEEPGIQTVRVFGDTAVVTALLNLRGTNEGVAFDRRSGSATPMSAQRPAGATPSVRPRCHCRSGSKPGIPAARPIA